MQPETKRRDNNVISMCSAEQRAERDLKNPICSNAFEEPEKEGRAWGDKKSCCKKKTL